MSETINYGIDLGTTNSLIARFRDGKMEVYKNPVGLKETLPSAVAFRKGRIIVGDKAREYVEKDPSNVFAGFKRKMGTAEKFFVADLGDFRSPADFSALVLQELKNFIHSGEVPDAAVITIPASFDTIQSNATKEAGYLAGYKEIVLLQEPVAASLAFANNRPETQPLKGQWLVYDLGGGTFDVALVRFEEHEMRVVDHEGDNYLGGLDFDNALIEKVIVPQIKAKAGFEGIEEGLRRPGNVYNKLYYKLLHKAEQAKIELSSLSSTEIEFDAENESGDEEEFTLTITREQFESVVQPQIAYSIKMVRQLLDKNRLAPGDVEEIILIGGSTYIPLVRQMLEQQLGIKVNSSADPTTAVAAGAAYFAATRKRQQQPAANAPVSAGQPAFSCRMAYARSTREREEYFTALFSGNDLSGLKYRILRADGGFDSGLKPLQERISEMLPLLPQAANTFRLVVYDAAGNQVPADLPSIEIMQGQFSIQGQPLPDDICLEVDDPMNQTTRLEVVFEKNNILPLKKTVVRELSRIIRKGSDDSLIINVLEGNRFALPASNLPIGVIEIRGKDLETDLIKGSDVEIVLEINESRDLSIRATLLMNDQEFANVFTPSVRSISMDRLRGELKDMLWDVQKQMGRAERDEQYELAARLQQMAETLQQSYSRTQRLSDDDVTDEKYQLEERKRALARELDALTRDASLQQVVDDYIEDRDWCLETLQQDGDPGRMGRYRKIIQDENSYLGSGSIYLIKNKTQELRRLCWEVRKNDPATLIGNFYHFQGLPDHEYKEPGKARELLTQADKAIERQNYHELLALLIAISHLRYDADRKDDFNGTGLG